MLQLRLLDDLARGCGKPEGIFLRLFTHLRAALVQEEISEAALTTPLTGM
jgi:hypothetical protein